jgi:retinol dehydrogenase-14
MHFGHFLLTSLLKGVLQRTAESSPASPVRVVNVASFGSQVSTYFGADFQPSIFEGDGEGDLRGESTDAGSLKMYIRAKLANVLFTRQLAARWGAHSIVSCSMHVGAVATNVWTTDDMPPFVQMAVNAWSSAFFRTPEQGARTIMQCALGRAELVQGKYLNGMGQVVEEGGLAEPAKNDALAARLWQVSERITAQS